ncbi:hypothetical protein OPT61_g1687 [Boeremia exigua]|uniref:Uncharacterized protein n=1 Tax=Boeremia exigua TaxID=749465 RepID=A0ACC2IPG9_9PLEO|nr:hypothetical protein OPT61_g1687 [Boeremia exigua]
MRAVEELGLVDELVFTKRTEPGARNRFIYYPDRLNRLPSSTPSFGDVFALWRTGMLDGFLNAVKEPMQPKRSVSLSDETVGSFLARRVDKRIANNVISAAFHGIYAGDIWQLSAKTLLSMGWQLEGRYGTILGGFLRMQQESNSSQSQVIAHPYDVEVARTVQSDIKLSRELAGNLKEASVFSFKDGMQTLVKGLQAAMEKTGNIEIKLNSPVSSFKMAENEEQKVEIIAGSDANKTTENYDVVISTLRNAELTPYVTVMTVNLFFENPNLLSAEGFGYLIPQSIPFEQNPERALGVIFDNSAIKGQDTAAGTKLTVMMGGHWWNGFEGYPDEEEGLAMARSVIERHLGIKDTPIAHHVNLSKDCIPQYTLGYEDRLNSFASTLQDKFKGRLRVVGSQFNGVGVNDCISGAWNLARGLRNEGWKSRSCGLERVQDSRPWVVVNVREMQYSRKYNMQKSCFVDLIRADSAQFLPVGGVFDTGVGDLCCTSGFIAYRQRVSTELTITSTQLPAPSSAAPSQLVYFPALQTQYTSIYIDRSTIMLTQSQFWLCFFLLTSFLHFTAAATVAHANKISFAQSSSLVLDSAHYRLSGLYCCVHDEFFAFLWRNDMPPWLFFLLTATISSRRLSQAIIAVINTAFNTLDSVVHAYYGYHRDVLIARLQKELSEYYHPDVVKHLHKTHSQQSTQLKQQIQFLRSKVQLTHRHLTQSRCDVTALSSKNNELQHRLETISVLYNVEAVRKKEKDHNLLLRSAQDEIIGLKAELAEVEKKRQKVLTDLENELNEKQSAIERRDAEIRQLKHDPKKDAIIHQLRHQDALMTTVKMTLFGMSTSGDEIQQATATLFVAALRQSGIDLTSLGIDPHQHQNYLTWLQDKYEGRPSALSPSTGFQLQSSRGPLSGAYVSSNKVYGPTNLNFSQPISQQMIWRAPVDTGYNSVPDDIISDHTDCSMILQEPGSTNACPPVSTTGPELPSATNDFETSSLGPFPAADTSNFETSSGLDTFMTDVVCTSIGDAVMEDCFDADTIPTSNVVFVPSLMESSNVDDEMDTTTTFSSRLDLDPGLDSASALALAPSELPHTFADDHELTGDSNDTTTSELLSSVASSETKKTPSAKIAALKRAALKRAAHQSATLSAYHSNSTSSPATSNDDDTRPISSFGCDLGPLFTPHATSTSHYGPFNAATSQYLTPAPGSAPGTPITPSPSFRHNITHTYMSDPVEIHTTLMERYERCQIQESTLHKLACIDSLDRKLFMHRSLYRRNFGCVPGIGSVFRSAGLAARSKGPDFLRSVQTRVAACRSTLRGRGGISRR